MAIAYYDDAFTEKLRSWTKSAQIQITSPDETRRIFEIIADKSDDEPIKLPLICLRRTASYEILNINKKPMTFDGIMLDSTIEKSISLNAIPVSIPYQIDVYTRYFREADEIARNLIFNIINYPKLTITIPYESINYEHDSNIRINPEITDNSDIPERLIPGQFTRITLNINIDDAYLFDARVRNNWSIETNFEID